MNDIRYISTRTVDTLEKLSDATAKMAERFFGKDIDFTDRDKQAKEILNAED